MSKSITIPCRSCSGTGHRSLPAKYDATLKTIRRLGRATCQRVHDVMVANGTISCGSVKTLILTHKRVQKLEAWGLVKKAGKATPEDQDLRKAAWEFRVVA